MQFIVVPNNIRSSVLYKDFIKNMSLPGIDELLDFRIRVNEIRSESSFPDKWFDIEIAAIDFLLDLHNNRTVRNTGYKNKINK